MALSPQDKTWLRDWAAARLNAGKSRGEVGSLLRSRGIDPSEVDAEIWPETARKKMQALTGPPTAEEVGEAIWRTAATPLVGVTKVPEYLEYAGRALLKTPGAAFKAGRAAGEVKGRIGKQAQAAGRTFLEGITPKGNISRKILSGPIEKAVMPHILELTPEQQERWLGRYVPYLEFGKEAVAESLTAFAPIEKGPATIKLAGRLIKRGGKPATIAEKIPFIIKEAKQAGQAIERAKPVIAPPEPLKPLAREPVTAIEPPKLAEPKPTITETVKAAPTTIFKEADALAAKERLRQKWGTMRATAPEVNSDDLADLLIYGGYHFEKGIREFDDWAKLMVREFGEPAAPHLDKLWQAVNSQYINEKYIASINMLDERLGTGKKLKDHIVKTAVVMEKDLNIQRRGVKTWEMTEKEAADLGLTLEDIANIRAGTALNAAQQRAVGNIMKGSAERAVKLAEKYNQTGAASDRIAAKLALQESMTTIQAAAGSATEAGRSLNILRQQKQAWQTRNLSNKTLEKLTKNLDGIIPDNILDAFIKLPKDDPAAHIRFLRQFGKHTFSDKAYYYFISSILSNPITHTTNSISNAFNTIAHFAKRPIRGLIDIPVSKLQKRPQYYYWNEISPAAIGLVDGTPKGFRKGLEAFISGIKTEEAAKFLGQGEYAIRYEPRGGLKNPLTYPLRALGAEDAIFRSINYEIALRAKAYRIARSEGLRGEKIAQRMAELLDSPTEAMLKEASEVSNDLVFTNKPDEIMRTLLKLRQKLQERGFPSKFIMTFVETPYNILGTSFRFSPFGLSRLIRNPAIRGTPLVSDVIAEAMIGSTLLLGVSSYAMRGLITGAVPRDKNSREAFYANGMQEYSLKIGDKWVSYRSLGPHGFPLAAAAAMFNEFEEKGKIPTHTAIFRLGMMLGKYSMDATYLTGLKDALNAMEEPDRFGEKYAARLGTGFIWPAGALRFTKEVFDPIIRKPEAIDLDNPESVWNYVKAGLPVLSKGTPARYDPYGRPAKRLGGWWTFAPIRVTKDTKDFVIRESTRIGLYPAIPKNKLTVDGKELKLTSKQYQEYQRISGNLLWESLYELYHTDYYRSLDKAAQLEEAERLTNSIRGEVREAFKDELFY
jgi:hypothetical protein